MTKPFGTQGFVAMTTPRRNRWLYLAGGFAALLGAAAWTVVVMRNHSLRSAALTSEVKAKNRVRVESLLRAGADPDASVSTQEWRSSSLRDFFTSVLGNGQKRRNRWSALRLAVAGGDAEIAKMLLKYGAADVNTMGRSIGNRRETLLMSAIYLGDAELVRMLMERGADIHARDWIRSTPAHYAVYSDNPRILEMLLSRGADSEAADIGNRTLLQGAAGSRKGPEMIRILLKWKADPNRRCQTGEIRLHWAALRGQAESVRALVEAGSRVNARAFYGATPLQYAKQRNHTKVVRILKAAGAQ